jgi:hypothetical protein
MYDGIILQIPKEQVRLVRISTRFMATGCTPEREDDESKALCRKAA